MKKLVLLVSFLLFITPSSLLAESFEWDFQIIPTGGVVSGAPETYVGWDYSVINTDAEHWLSFSIGVDNFIVQPTEIFDYPILAPYGYSGPLDYDSSSTSNYHTTNLGLYELLLTPNDGINPYSGTIILTALWSISLEDANNQIYISDALSITHDYTANLTAVPEPTTLLLLASGLIGCLGWNKRKEKSLY